MRIGLMLTAGLALTLGTALPAEAQFKPGKADQIKLGRQASQQVRQKERVLPSHDPRVQTLRRVADRLLSTVSPNPRDEPWEYTFDVIDNKQINAFALPGGPIYFYTGLLDRLQTEDQLAGILAHEIMHIRNEHWASAYNDNQKRQLGIGVLLTLLRANRTAFDIAGVADTLVFTLPYSRRHETEADERGMDMMIRAGYNPMGMADVFRILDQAAGGGRAPEFLSSHPD
ncbi:MAG TPA: M48 family metalloprotease, partial [Fimbriimonadaceae bacterium]|nr:M48 family metalloprotease [Fimbriimonadaceae bacterium]